MDYRTLGKSGLLVSLIGVGCNNFGFRDDLDPDAVVHQALELGINLFDTAESYGDGRSEVALGKALGNRRHEAIIATKWFRNSAGPYFGSRNYIFKAVERSLTALGTDYIDLYQYHRPDAGTPIEETLRALDDLRRQGKIRYIGLSNMPAWRVVEAKWTAQQLNMQGFIACQDEYSLLKRDIVDPDLLPVMQRYDIGLLPFFPIASGLLTGKYRRNGEFPEGSRFKVLTGLETRFNTSANWDVVDRLADFAAANGYTILELAFSWLAARPTVSSIIAGATRPEQVVKNAAAVRWKMTADELAEVDKITGVPKRPSAF